MSTRLIVAGAALLSVFGMPLPVHAQETGLAAIHAWVPVGRKTCMATHFHDGSGTGKTQKAAEREAIGVWESFTAWEYGPAWGRYALSESKKTTCSKDTQSVFTCQVTSRPCVMKGGTRVAGARKKKKN
jgi:hypothetical protein